MNLEAFIEARLAEKAAAAEEVQRHLSPGAVIDILLTRHEGDESYTKTMRPYDPARVLAEVAALRAVVELHEDCECADLKLGPIVFDPEPEVTLEYDSSGNPTFKRSIATQARLGCGTLRAIAAIWSDHEDYREEQP